MELQGLIDANWSAYEQKRFLNDDTKTKADGFDPESFKHVGFSDREEYLKTFVPALARGERVRGELNNFQPPRLSSINGSAYQALVIRYGILRLLIEQPAYQMEKEELLASVQAWQLEILDSYEEGDFDDGDELLHLSKAAVTHGSDIDDSELHLIFRFFELQNRVRDWKHEYYCWEDVFARLASIDRFPKVSRSESPEHALDTIEKGLWSLQEQALVYEIIDDDGKRVVGIPEDYADILQDWLPYEMSEANYRTMLETLEPFDRQPVLIETRETFGITAKNHGRNARRRENIVEKAVFPSDLFREVLEKDDLKLMVDEYGLDAHKFRTGEMIEAIIEYFEQTQRRVEEGEPDVELFLEFYADISNGYMDEIPPQLQRLVDDPDQSKQLEILFERATAEVFGGIFNLSETDLLGQHSSGTVADGQIKQDGKWLLWDNKRRAGNFKLDSTTRSKIKNYIDTKSQQHEVGWFVIIAPDFAESAAKNAKLMETQLNDVDIRLVKADDFQELAEFWRESFGESGHEFPLSMFNGTGLLDIEILKQALNREFSY